MDPDQISMFDAGRSDSYFTYSWWCGVEHVVRLVLVATSRRDAPKWRAQSRVFPRMYNSP